MAGAIVAAVSAFGCASANADEEYASVSSKLFETDELALISPSDGETYRRGQQMTLHGKCKVVSERGERQVPFFRVRIVDSQSSVYEVTHRLPDGSARPANGEVRITVPVPNAVGKYTVQLGCGIADPFEDKHSSSLVNFSVNELQARILSEPDTVHYESAVELAGACEAVALNPGEVSQFKQRWSWKAEGAAWIVLPDEATRQELEPGRYSLRLECLTGPTVVATTTREFIMARQAPSYVARIIGMEQMTAADGPPVFHLQGECTPSQSDGESAEGGQAGQAYDLSRRSIDAKWSHADAVTGLFKVIGYGITFDWLPQIAALPHALRLECVYARDEKFEERVNSLPVQAQVRVEESSLHATIVSAKLTPGLSAVDLTGKCGVGRAEVKQWYGAVVAGRWSYRALGAKGWSQIGTGFKYEWTPPLPRLDAYEIWFQCVLVDEVDAGERPVASAIQTVQLDSARPTAFVSTSTPAAGGARLPHGTRVALQGDCRQGGTPLRHWRGQELTLRWSHIAENGMRHVFGYGLTPTLKPKNAHGDYSVILECVINGGGDDGQVVATSAPTLYSWHGRRLLRRMFGSKRSTVPASYTSPEWR